MKKSNLIMAAVLAGLMACSAVYAAPPAAMDEHKMGGQMDAKMDSKMDGNMAGHSMGKKPMAKKHMVKKHKRMIHHKMQ